MNWFTAKLVFKIDIAGKPAQQFDEQIRLIEAADMQEAFIKSQEIGRGQQVSFTGSNNQLRKWVFLGTSSITPINRLHDGVQCFSITNETEEPETYTTFVQERNRQFEQRLLPIHHA
jgi:hypothetical protein